MLIGGFVIDNLTLQRIDLLFENLVLIGYLLLTGFAILLINFYDAGVFKKKLAKILEQARPFLFFLISFSLGGVFSGFTVFYVRSASFSTSIFFILMLVLVMLSTEFLKKQYNRLVIQVGIYYLAIFTFLVFALPVLTKQMNEWIFLLSGIFSLILIGLFIYLLKLKIPEKFFINRNKLLAIISGIYLLLNIFYFTNIIPPIPLALKEADFHHSITRDKNGEYVFDKLSESWWKIFLPYQTINIKSGDSIYFFTSVFAPTKLGTKISHEWQFKNPETKKWETANKITYPIIGGRDGVYRGYSMKNSLQKGFWRVRVLTERNQVVGSKTFKIEN